MYAVIGGSGFEKFDDFETIEDLDRETPFGLASSGLKRVKVMNKEFLFISRHGAHHEHLPSEINYRANIFSLKKHGAKGIISISAVGSLDKNIAPGDLVIPHQYIDRTKGIRQSTFLGEGLIGHVSLAQPICLKMEENIRTLTLDFKTHFSKTYVCIEGPYFSTKAESLSYRQLGADIIGMTNFPEYALSREAGLPYLPCCFVTDFDCWDESIPHVTVEEVIKVMKSNNIKAFQLLKQILALPNEIWLGSKAFEGGLKTSLFMAPDSIPEDKKKWLSIFLS